jgi:hypothetical protein
MMRTLLHDFFMSEYFWCASFHKDDFLDDMMSGGSDFCSPLLVNVILAWASVRAILPTAALVQS